MAIHKLHIDEFDETEYQLIAIHTTLEDYKLAYYINQKLPVLLARCKEDVSFYHKESKTQIPRFTYDDEITETSWNLIPNQTEITIQNPVGENLFNNDSDAISTRIYVLPEFKKVDFLLKIEPCDDVTFVRNIITLLNTIDKISTIYLIDKWQIKSKNNLIF